MKAEGHLLRYNIPDSNGSINKRSLKSDSITFLLNKVSNITVAVISGSASD